MSYLEERGIVHRDLAARNVLGIYYFVWLNDTRVAVEAVNSELVKHLLCYLVNMSCVIKDSCQSVLSTHVVRYWARSLHNSI